MIRQLLLLKRMMKVPRLQAPWVFCLVICLIGISIIVITEPSVGQVEQTQAESSWERLDEADTLEQKATKLYNTGHYADAIPLIQRSLAIRKQQLGPNHPSTATSLNNLALLYQDMGRYGEAEPLYEQALAIAQKQLGSEHPGVAANLNNLAGLYQDMGRYGEAESLYEQALAIAQKQLGSEHPDVAASLNNLAGLYQDMGRYGEAESLYEQALAIAQKQLGSEHPDVAASLNNLAGLYRDIGRYRKAEPLYKQALAIAQKQLGANHPNVATSLSNLAGLYRDMKRYGEAEPLYKQALAIAQKQLGANHPNVAASLDDLAGLYRNTGHYKEAESLYKQALAIAQKQLGANHPNVVASLNNLAGLYRNIGRYKEAEPLYRQTLAIAQEQLGANHPDIAKSLNLLALIYSRERRYEQAQPLWNQAAQIEETNLARLIAIGSEADKQAYLATLWRTTHGLHSLALQSANPELTRLALTTLLRRKGRILDAVTDSFQIMRQQLADDPEAQHELDQLIEIRRQLAALITQGQRNRTPEQYQTLYNTLLQQEQDLESRISDRSAAFQAVDNPVTLEDVQTRIPASAALIEFVKYQPYDFHAESNQRWGNPHYVAYILKANGNPQVFDLGAADNLEELIQDFQNALRNSQDASLQHLSTVRQTGQDLYAQILEPLAEHLAQIDHLLLSPDGALNLIPFEALTNSQGHFLIQDYTFSYLTSGRDLLYLETLPDSQQPPLIVANPNYNQAGTQIATTTRSTHNQRSRDLISLHFGHLPGTQQEADDLDTLFRQISLPVTILTNTQATEAQVKQAQAPSILHIATHGFFLADSTMDLAPEPDFSAINEQSALHIENPLLRSGLALANANAPRPDPDSNQDDGILTALEMTGMNLYGTQLVVLSACETGLGDVGSGEGVYGLRRALVIAGVQSQVVSLWAVADDVTKDLMVDYYNRLFETGQPIGRHEALRQAQLAMLNSDQYQHPYYWAAFIASGDWRSLSY